MRDSVPGAVCILLPVLNEVAHVELLWGRIAAAMGRRAFSVCFVDDGSRDGTLDLLHALQGAEPDRVHVISRVKKQRGSQRGSALHTAMLWGLRDPNFRVFIEMDGDLSHRPEELQRGIALIDSGECDVAIASKYLLESRVTNRPLGRTAVSFICNLAVRALIAPSIRDYSNGFRFYNREAAMAIARTRIRYGSPIYLTEAMAVWLACGYRVGEFPTIYVGRNEGLSKLRKRDLLKAGIAVFEISARYHLGFASTIDSRAVESAQTPSDAEIS